MRKQEELTKEVETKKEMIDDLERVKTEKDQKIVNMESELLKEKENIQKK
jgi:hypothetical protein